MLALCVGASAYGFGKYEEFVLQSQKPVPDKALQKRLRIVKVYKTTEPETLVSLAHLLYGHETWWVNLKKLNPKLRKYQPKQPIRVGMTIRFLAPKVGRKYVVQPNDWLIRIAIWKYGNTEAWNRLFEKNVRRISKPNLIFPGDSLILETRGTIKVAKNKRHKRETTLITGNASPEEKAAVTPIPGPSPSPISSPSASPEPSPSPSPLATLEIQPSPASGDSGNTGGGIFGLSVDSPVWGLTGGFALGIALLWGVSAFVQHRRREWIKKRREMGYELDRSLLTEDGGEVERQPNYHWLSRSRWKKYFRIFSKFTKK